MCLQRSIPCTLFLVLVFNFLISKSSIWGIWSFWKSRHCLLLFENETINRLLDSRILIKTSSISNVCFPYPILVFRLVIVRLELVLKLERLYNSHGSIVFSDCLFGISSTAIVCRNFDSFIQCYRSPTDSENMLLSNSFMLLFYSWVRGKILIYITF